MINIQEDKQSSQVIRFFVTKDGQEVGHVYLYFIKNDIHDRSYGLVEDLFVHESWRKQGIGKQLMQKAIEEAKKQNCYKVILQSRHANTLVHDWYLKLGFKNHGYNFRMNI